jgi:hypothetical protein
LINQDVFTYLEVTPVLTGRAEVRKLLFRRPGIEEPAEVDDWKRASGDVLLGGGLLLCPDVPVRHQIAGAVPSLRECLHVGHRQIPSCFRVRHWLIWFSPSCRLMVVNTEALEY